MKISNKVRIALMLVLLVSTTALLVSQKPSPKTEAYNNDESVSASAGENNQINKIVSLIKRAKVTPTPTIFLAGTGASLDTALSPSPSPSPSPTNQLAQTSPTPSAAASTPTSTLTPSTGSGPTATPTPTPTVAPTPTPAQNASTSVSLYLTPPGNYTPEARASFNMEVIKNGNGYWDFLLAGEITKLMPSREYQVWLCGANCSSNTEARFNTDENGNKTLANAKISGHNQEGDPLNRIVIYEMPQPGEIISDPTSCWMVSNDSIPCLKREFGL